MKARYNFTANEMEVDSNLKISEMWNQITQKLFI